jgi:hypothetical protein
VSENHSSVILHKCVLFYSDIFILMYTQITGCRINYNPNYPLKFEYLKLALNPGFSLFCSKADFTFFWGGGGGGVGRWAAEKPVTPNV